MGISKILFKILFWPFEAVSSDAKLLENESVEVTDMD